MTLALPAEARVPDQPEASGAQGPEQAPKAPPRARPPVKVNRTVPKVEPPPAFPRFSEQPTDLEIFRARVFEEPLVATGATTVDENRALAQALVTYLHSARRQESRALEGFLDAFPSTAWRASLLTNLGIVYRRSGYFSQAYSYWEQAWALAKDLDEPKPRAVADRAFGELAELSARLGRMDALAALLEEAAGRVFQGSVTEKITGAKEGLWLMRNKPEDAFRCGPMALDRILAAKRPGYQRSELLTGARSTTQGTSLAQMQALAGRVGLSLQMAKRSPGAPVLLPAMVHWKAGHFAALVKERDGFYLMQDPTFGDELWVGRDALEKESSGYFLVPGGPLSDGWSPVSESDGAGVWGKGAAAGPDQGNNNPGSDPGAGGNPGGGGGGSCEGLAGFTFSTLVASLTIIDTPLRYTPALGPSVAFTVYYSQREAFQPQTFLYSNLGPKWTFDWLSYLEEDDPDNPGGTIALFMRGAGREVYTGYDSGTATYAPGYRTQAVVKRVAPSLYERRLPDGSVEVFAQPDGATGPRKIFMTQHVDPQGNRLAFTYDTNMRLVAVQDALGQVTTLSYELPSDMWKITKITDPFGRFATFDYDALGRLVKITDVEGLASEFSYLSTGDFVAALRTPYGTTSFSKGESGVDRWVEAVDPLGGRERLEYLNYGYVNWDPASMTPPGYYLSDTSDAISAYWDKRAMALAPGDYNAAHVTRWMRNSSFNQSTSTKGNEKRPLESRIWYAYAGQTFGAGRRFIGTSDLPTEAMRILDDGSLQKTTFEHNASGMKIREVDPVGRETVYVYGTNNVPDPVPATGMGTDLLQVKVRNAASPGGWDLTASYTYDAQHQPLTVTDAAGQTTTYTYTANGQVETVTTPPRAGITEDRTTTYTYDPVTGNLLTVTGPGGVTTTYTYDGYNRLRTTTDHDGYTLTYDYDAFDRPTRMTYPDGTYEETEYERLDPVRRRDRLGRWSHTFYDPLRRVSATRDAAGRTARQEWCTCGSLERLVDPNGNPTSWEHDTQGRVTKETRANGSFKTTVYETTTSRVKKVIDAKLQETQYGYAKDDKVLTISHVNAEHPTPNVTFSYTDPATGLPDAHGRLRQVVDGTGTTAYSYHPFGQLGAGQLAAVDGPLADDTISYGYDDLGRVVSRTLNGVTTTWAYDALGRLTTIGDPVGDFVYGYVASTGRVNTVTYPNGQTSSYGYYPLAQDLRLQEIHHRRPGGGATLNRFTYTYDVGGNILTWGQQTDSNPAQTYTFEYDRADQLTAGTLAGPAPKRYRYAYDPAGNRTAEQIDDAVTGASYDAMNRLVSQFAGGALSFRGALNEPGTVTVGGTPAGVSAGNQFSGAAAVPSGTSQVVVTATDPSGNLRTNTYEVAQTGATKTFTYDANGNLTGDGTKTYEWDAENRLIAVKDGPSTLASLTYDASGRRATKTAGAVTTTFVYDGAQFLEERPSGGATTRYAYGPGIDQPLVQSVAGVASYFAADHLGSVVRLTDAAGAPVFTRDYDPWGRLLQGSAASGYAFTGREWDSETGLYYYRARYYDAKIGRFLSEDPIGLKAGTNYFAYVENEPTKSYDPFGLAPFATDDEAAIDACKSVITYERWKWEFGGKVCKCNNNTGYIWTGPKTSQAERHVDVGTCPAGTENAGYWHTHPDNFGFSDTDKNISYRTGKPGYVLTLNGDVQKYIWQQGYPKTIATLKTK